jgi:hypothetical protein
MNLDEESTRFLEEHAPKLFSAAVTQAYWGSFASGHAVLQREGDELVEVSPDGSKKVIKALPPLVAAEPGSRRRLA